jgi:DNA-binding LytR/AlgR family response regulator
MRILIVEDEIPARERLAQSIRRAEPGVVIAGECDSVATAIEWLTANSQPNLLFLDIQLADGLSFDILRRVRVECPVIFVTAYEEYILEALESNGIDYLLKPIRQERLEAALAKYRRLAQHFAGDYRALLGSLARREPGFRNRFLVRKRLDFVVVRTEDVAYFYSLDKISFLVDREGQKYVLDKTLAELETELDPARFFRISRNVIASLDAVVRFRPEFKGRLAVDLRPSFDGVVTVSQERARAFRDWLAGVGQ